VPLTYSRKQNFILGLTCTFLDISVYLACSLNFFFTDIVLCLKNAQYYDINCLSSVNFIELLFSKCFATPYFQVRKAILSSNIFYTWSDMPVILVRCVTYIVNYPVCVCNVNIYNTVKHFVNELKMIFFQSALRVVM
jgi:hypothetical protein